MGPGRGQSGVRVECGGVRRDRMTCGGAGKGALGRTPSRVGMGRNEVERDGQGVNGIVGDGVGWLGWVRLGWDEMREAVVRWGGTGLHHNNYPNYAKRQ